MTDETGKDPTICLWEVELLNLKTRPGKCQANAIRMFHPSKMYHQLKKISC